MKSHGFFSMLVRFKQSKGDKSLLDNHVNEGDAVTKNVEEI